MTETFDQRLTVAMQVARQVQAGYWAERYLEHRRHTGFRTIQNACRREIGFTCACTGEPETWLISLRGFRELLPEARSVVVRCMDHDKGLGRKEHKRKTRRADCRAKALLHRWLTREQRWALRASRSFEVQAQDGTKHSIRAIYGNNVVELGEDGHPLFSHCIVPASGISTIPVYDLMLAQKVLLETDVGTFRQIAKSRDLRAKKQDTPAPEQAPHRILTVGQLLVRDEVPDEAQVLYEHDYHAAAPPFVLDVNLCVVPLFEAPIAPPTVTCDTDHEECVLRLITGVPAHRLRDVGSVLQHFNDHDLTLDVIVTNPTTVGYDHADFRAPHLVLDERIPPGVTYCLAASHFVGVAHTWRGRRGYCVHNLNAIAVYDPELEAP